MTGTLNRPCTDGCVDPYICDTATEKCKLKPGSRCMNTEDCTSNAECIGSVCVIKVTPAVSPTTDISPQALQSPSLTSPSTSGCQTCPKRSYSSASSYGVYTDEQSLIYNTYSASSSETTNPTVSESEYDYGSTQSESFESIREMIKYRGDIIKLHDQNTVSVNDRTVSTDVPVHSIINFNDRIYVSGGSDRRLLSLSEESYDRNSWKFGLVPAINMKYIKHFSTTSDGKYMWLQDHTRGNIYDRNFNRVSSAKTHYSRNYGSDLNNYVENNGSYITVTSETGSTRHNNIKYANMNGNNEVFVVKSDRDDVSKIAVIDDEGVYLS